MSFKINNRVYNTSAIISVEKKVVGIRVKDNTMYSVVIVHENGQETLIRNKNIDLVEKVFNAVVDAMGTVVDIDSLVTNTKEEHLKVKKDILPVENKKEEIPVSKQVTKRRRRTVKNVK